MRLDSIIVVAELQIDEESCLGDDQSDHSPVAVGERADAARQKRTVLENGITHAESLMESRPRFVPGGRGATARSEPRQRRQGSPRRQATTDAAARPQTRP